MAGRNGVDQLGRAAMFAAMLLFLASVLTGGKLSQILLLLAVAAVIYVYFRMFSRNIARRRAENEWYVTYIALPLRSFAARDRKHYRYFKCPGCGQLLRAPKGRGKIRVTCSRCHNVFEKKV